MILSGLLFYRYSKCTLELLKRGVKFETHLSSSKPPGFRSEMGDVDYANYNSTRLLKSPYILQSK